MAKFCTYCGKPLPESGICGCEASEAAKAAKEAAASQTPAGVSDPVQAESAAQPSEPVSESAAPNAPSSSAQSAAGAAPAAENVYIQKTKAAVSQSVPFVKDYWKSPMNATLRVLKEKNLALSIVMMVVNALVTGLFLFTCLSKVTGSFKSMYKEMSGLFGGSARVSISTPFFASLLYGILIAVVALALSALALFVLLKIFKINASINNVVMAVGVNSVLCTACLVLSLLCALFGWFTPTLICLMLSFVVWVVLGVLLLIKVFGANVSGLMMTVSSALFAVVLALNCWVGVKLSIKAAGQIEVADVKLQESFEEIEDEMGDLDVGEILDGLMNSMMYGF